LAKESNSKRKRQKAPGLEEEHRLIKNGFKNIAGLDEAGRGALSGPIVAAACILNHNKRLYKIRDSKLLGPNKRETLAKKIKQEAKAHSFGIVENSEIEKFGLHKAGLLALKRAVEKLKIKPDFILVDYYKVPDIPISQKSIIKGDSVCASIAAASILAKVFRDNLMSRLAKRYPGYFFEENKGYGTKKHLEALKKLGPCKIHRRNFGPVRKIKKLKGKSKNHN